MESMGLIITGTASRRYARHSLAGHKIGGGTVGRASSRPRRHGKAERGGRRRNRVVGSSTPHSELEATPRSRIVGEAVDWILFGGLVAVMVGVGFVMGLPSWGLWIVALVGAPVLLTGYEIAAIAAWGMTLGKRSLAFESFAPTRSRRRDGGEQPFERSRLCRGAGPRATLSVTRSFGRTGCPTVAQGPSS
jgi:hypothetical protein